MARFAVVISRYNTEVTDGLLEGARRFLAEKGVTLTDQDVISAPGAFEIPLIAQTAAETGRYDGIICLGCVIKGDTAHFEFISLGATLGILQGMLSTRIPISFGVLTTYTEEQALARARQDAENKGLEAARACYESARTLAELRATTVRS